MGIEIFEDPNRFGGLKAIWNDANKDAPFYSGDFSDFLELSQRPGIETRIILSHSGNAAPAIAPFFIKKDIKEFNIGERRLFSLQIRACYMYSPWLLKTATEAQIQEIFFALADYSDFDWVDLQEVPIESSLHRAMSRLSWRWIVARKIRKLSHRWLIDLPDTFDELLEGLSYSTRQSTKRKIRKLEKKYNLKLEVIDDREDIQRFLDAGERISRKTYQWHLGSRLENNSETRHHYERLCQQGRMRCYLICLDGEPRAFLRGTIEGDMYNYETPGFDPAFRKESLGVVLLMLAVRDIIENTKCRVFDFGSGGDVSGYKSQYGTRNVPCIHYELGKSLSPYASMLAGAQGLLNRTKGGADLFLGQGPLRQAIKRAIKKHEKV